MTTSLSRIAGVMTAIILPAAFCFPACAACQLVLLASLPVTYAGASPVIPIQIDGHTEQMMVDTGADSSYLTPAAFRALGPNNQSMIYGLSSLGLDGSQGNGSAMMKTFMIGHATVRDQIFLVAAFSKNGNANGGVGQPALDGLLGYDVLQSFDVGLDLPDNLINLYGLQSCATATLPWADNFDVEPYFARPDRLNVPEISTQLDAGTVPMVIDSGATRSIVFAAHLAQAAIKPMAILAAPLGATGFNGGKIAMQREEFASFTVGAEEFDNDWLDVAMNLPAELVRENGGLIGDDYLAHHLVYLANDTRTAYLSLSVAGK